MAGIFSKPSSPSPPKPNREADLRAREEAALKERRMAAARSGRGRGTVEDEERLGGTILTNLSPQGTLLGGRRQGFGRFT